MSEVGALIIKLQAETAQFREDMGKVKGDLAGLTGQSQETGKAMDFSMQEAKGSMMLLGEETGVRIPRHLQTLIAQIPGVGAAFSAMLPLVGVTAAIAIIIKLHDKIEATEDKIATFGAAWASATSTTVDKVGALDVEILKLQDSTAKLYGKVPQNGPAIAAMEALEKINSLDSGIMKAIGDMQKLMTSQDVGLFDQLLTGKMGTQGIEDALKPKMQAAQNAFAEVINAESQLELDTVNKASAAKIAADQKDITSKKATAAAALAAVQAETAGQQTLLNTAAKEQEQHQTSLHYHLQAKQLTAEQTAAEMTRQSAARQMLTSIQQQTTALQTQLGLENSLTAATKANAAAQGNKDSTSKQADLLKTSQEIMKAFNATVKLDESYAQLEEHIKAVNFKLLADDAENAAKAEEKMLKSGEALTKSFENIAKAQSTIASEKAVASLQAQAEGYQKLADQGLITQQHLAKDLAPIYQQETDADAKLAAVQDELNREQALEKSQRASGETVLANDTIAREITLQDKLYQIRQAGDAKQAQLDKQRYADFSRLMTQETTAFNNAIAKQIVMGGNLGQSMRMIGAQMLQDAIRYALQEVEMKIGLHTAMEAILKMLHLTTQTTNVAATLAATKVQAAAEAGLAGASGVASFAAAPWPIDMGAPAFGASMMASAMGMAAFEEGGKIPGAGAVPILGHGGETVVTRALTDRVETAEGRGSNSRGEMHMHNVFAPNIQALDSEGVDRILVKHGTTFQRHITSAMRKMNRG
jgi:hypothetical protein